MEKREKRVFTPQISRPTRNIPHFVFISITSVDGGTFTYNSSRGIFFVFGEPGSEASIADIEVLSDPGFRDASKDFEQDFLHIDVFSRSTELDAICDRSGFSGRAAVTDQVPFVFTE